MTILTEGNLQSTFSQDANIRKFDDDQSHGLSHCMKAQESCKADQRYGAAGGVPQKPFGECVSLLGQLYFAAEGRKWQDARVGGGIAKIFCAEVYLIEP